VFPQSAGRQFDPILRSGRLWWRQGVGFFSRLFTCAGFPDRCAPKPLAATIDTTSFAGSDTRVAWASILSDQIAVFVCRVDEAGACPPRPIGTFPGGEVDLAVDRHRVVWSAPGPNGDFDIHFCEDDDHTGECPIQRLTASWADQRHPAVSGTRVVWEDARDGATAIFGFELPSLDPVPDRGTAVGRPLRIAVRGRDPAGGPIALSAAFADGTPLAERGATFTDRGDGTGVFKWRPRQGDVGRHIVTFAGRTAGHLTTRTSARIDVAIRSPQAAR
jgi:beta propeller repeat protein